MKELVNIKTIRSNPNNPRIIKDNKFKKLVNSIKDFPEMLEKRPIIVDENMIVLGGNMRLKACVEAGLKDVWIDKAEGWTEDQKKEFIIKDNTGYGEWDWDILANDWDTKLINDWGLDIWQPQEQEFNPTLNPQTSYSDITNEQIEKKARELAQQMIKESHKLDIACPYCGEEFSIDE